MPILFVFIVLLWPMTPFAERCGAGGPCEVEGGYYLAETPDDWDGVSPLPVVVFYHGWNASPEGMFRNRAMVEGVTRRGALFVSPWARTGYWRQIGEGRAESGRDELAYARAVMADVRRRWPVDERVVLASGFSRGASMVWNLACYAGDLFSGFAPIAGGFWHSQPEDCPSGPVRMRHIHGTADRVVSFDRVGIYNSRPIPEGLAFLRTHNGCTGAPELSHAGPRLSCETWSNCQAGQVQLCLHDGGHSIPAEWVGDGLDWLDQLMR